MQSVTENDKVSPLSPALQRLGIFTTSDIEWWWLLGRVGIVIAVGVGSLIEFEGPTLYTLLALLAATLV